MKGVHVCKMNNGEYKIVPCGKVTEIIDDVKCFLYKTLSEEKQEIYNNLPEEHKSNYAKGIFRK